MIITTALQISNSSTGEVSPLYATPDSGKIVYRDKIDSLIGIKHPGIVLGKDMWGNKWIVHNHYENGKVKIVKSSEFLKGERMFYDTRPVSYDALSIVHRAIAAYNKGEFYHWLKNNCQHFVSDITTGKHESFTVDRVSKNVSYLGFVMALLGVFTKNNGLVKIGLATAGVGLVGRGVSRL